MNYKSILFVVGLTGVGKSTTLDKLLEQLPELKLLPNRRILTDEIIIPTMQRLGNQSEEPVQDRAKRFELTKAYRELSPEGMSKVVSEYLKDEDFSGQDLIFDNIRGVNEVSSVATLFENARVLMLDAPEEVRLQRLVGRDDVFDKVAVDAADVGEDADVARAKAILAKEKLNYDAAATKAFLDEHFKPEAYLYIDTHKLSVEEVSTKIVEWF